MLRATVAYPPSWLASMVGKIGGPAFARRPQPWTLPFGTLDVAPRHPHSVLAVSGPGVRRVALAIPLTNYIVSQAKPGSGPVIAAPPGFTELVKALLIAKDADMQSAALRTYLSLDPENHRAFRDAVLYDIPPRALYTSDGPASDEVCLDVDAEGLLHLRRRSGERLLSEPSFRHWPLPAIMDAVTLGDLTSLWPYAIAGDVTGTE